MAERVRPFQADASARNFVDARYLKDFIAGYASGCSAVLASQPIDVVRVRLQTQTSPETAAQVVQKMLQREGVVSFYKGTLPPMTGVGLLMSIAFSSQQQMRRWLTAEGRALRIQDNAICGAYGGLCQGPVANTIELLKVRLQVQRDVANPLNLRQMMSQVWQISGIRGLARGLGPTVARDAIGYGFYFAFCETMLAWLTPPSGTKKDVHPLKVMAVGMAGGIFYWVPVMPIDTIKSRLHSDSLTTPKYYGALDCLRTTVRTAGVTSLYRGLLLTCIMALPKNAAKLPVFNFVQGLLQDF
jgi:solute carrier family 25 carnitine/acylcarnitine transporter 20/29